MAWSRRIPSALLLLAACPAAPGEVSTDETSVTPDTTDTGSESSAATDPSDSVTPTTSTSTTDGEDTTLTSTDDDTTLTTMDTLPDEPVCGNGELEEGEFCDDGNVEDGDCCAANCNIGAPGPGSECWTLDVEGTKNGADQGLGVVLDKDANVYMLATVVDSVAGGDIMIRKYDPGPFSQWTQQYDGGVNGSDVGFAMTGDDEGFMIALGRQTVAMGQPGVAWLSKCTPTGQVVWAFTDPGPLTGSDVALIDNELESAGDFVVVGVIKQGDNNALVRRYSDGGGEQWSKVHAGAANGPDTASGVAVDGAGNILVVGREFTDLENFNIWIQQYAPDGELGWSETLDGGAGGNDWANAVAFSQIDEAVVVGRVDVGGGFSDGWIRKYDELGGEVWTRTFEGELGESDEAIAVAIAKNGDVVVAGKTEVADRGLDIFVRKLDLAGEELWTRTHGGPQDDDVGDVAVGADGSVVVIGTEVVVPTINSDVWLRKYSP